ncbi:hypothetical protein [Zymomonas mobilis]|nr:hypothetical protein [Zymomonas mobilis]
MKITKIEIFHVHTRPQSGQRPILVKVSTDEGIYGLGEAVSYTHLTLPTN